MGYFNYFIKCIIRNISYKLCKPKILFTILLSVIVLFSLKHFGFCALDDPDYEMISDGFSTLTTNQGTLITQLSLIGVDVTQISDELRNINLDIEALKGTTSNIDDNLLTLLNRVNSLNTNILNIYNRLDSNQKELLSTLNSNNDEIISELKTENQKVLEELQQLRDALVGSEASPVSSTYLGLKNVNIGGTVYNGCAVIEIPMEYGYTYKINLTYTNDVNSDVFVSSYLSDVLVSNTSTVLPGSFKWHGRVGSDQTVTYSLTTREYQKKYLYLSWGTAFDSVSVTASIEGMVDAVDRTNQGIQEGNQLQQENNQLQQEQNDFLQQETSDNDVSVDSFNSVDSNDITSSGLTGIFSTIYNSINSWNSKDIVLPIPFTDKSLTIPSNYTNNMLSRVGGGSLITIISTVYYFLVARFIVYSVTGIINSIKSGSILETDTKNNITTEML